MFRKEIVIKSNVKLKSSDKKKFAANLTTNYNGINADINFKNDEIALLKVTTNDGKRLEIYTVNNDPWIFVIEERWYPTVYLLWKFPEIMFAYVTHPTVLVKLQEGADLMLPGLIFDGEVSVKKLGNLSKFDPCAVRLMENRAAVAVGKTNISSLDMFECGMRGKGVQILHVVGDFLWKMGSKEAIPFIPFVKEQERQPLPEASNESDELEERLPSLNISDDEQRPSVQEGEKLEQLEESPDDLFKKYFLLSVKQKLSPGDFPMLASTFLGSILSPFMNELCGGERRVNVKDTKYKKFSVFLSAMKDEGILELEERQKGIQYISSVRFNHEAFSKLETPTLTNSPSCSQKKIAGGGSEFKEMFSVSAAVLPLIRQSRPNVKKGDAISSAEFRSIVTDYVKTRQLQNGSTVKLDEILTQCLNDVDRREMSWDVLFKNLFAKMRPCYEFQFADGQSGVKKGKPPNVVISTARRSGNKKITLINNLEGVGVEPAPFAKDLQIAAAASSTLNYDVPSSIGAQVQVQGDDTELVVKLLVEKYNVNKKIIKIV